MGRTLQWGIALLIFGIVFCVMFTLCEIAHGEVITENRDGVIYIYNINHKTDSDSEYQPIDKQETPNTVSMTKEEARRIKANESISRGHFKDAAWNLEMIGDYESAQDCYQQELAKLLQDPETPAWRFQSLYREIGDYENYMIETQKEIDGEIAEGDYVNAAEYYKRLFNTEKVKEMYKLQQEKVRTTLVE